MKIDSALKLEEDMHKAEACTAAAVRITKAVQTKTKEIVARAEQYDDDMKKIQKAS